LRCSPCFDNRSGRSLSTDYTALFSCHTPEISIAQIEAAGFEVLGGLLEKVVPALVNEDKTSAEKKVHQLIPPQFTKGKNKYEKLLSATDFVSGMTDSYAVTLYRRLRGIELPRG
jgi:dGTPase